MNRKLRFMKNILAEILNYLLFFAAGKVLLTDFAGIRQGMSGLFLLGLLPVFYYIVRKSCRRFGGFFLLHLLPVVLFLALYQGNLFWKIWVIFVMLCLFMISFGKKIRSDEMGMDVMFPVAFGVLILVLYLVDQKQGEGTCEDFLFYVLVLFLVGYLAHYFLDRFIYYIEMNNRTTENIPAGSVFCSSAALAGGFLAFTGTLIMLGAKGEMLGRIGAAIYQTVIMALRFLFSMLPKGGQEEAEISEILPESGDQAMPWAEMEAVEPSVFLKILEKILGIVMVAMLTVLLLAAVVKLVRFIREIFLRKRAELGILEEAWQDRVEKLVRHEGPGKKKEQANLWEKIKKAASPEERIRRIYKKEIQKRVAVFEGKEKEKLTVSSTPREWCRILFSEKEGAALEFAALYEKARYGHLCCGGEDVKRARKLAEEFHR